MRSRSTNRAGATWVGSDEARWPESHRRACEASARAVSDAVPRVHHAPSAPVLRPIGAAATAATHAEPARAVLLVDVDAFREINRSRGQAAGDEVLRELSARIAGCAAGAAVARLGVDRFAVTLGEHSTAPGADQLAARLLEACTTPFSLGDGPLSLRVSIGIAAASDEVSDPQSLLRAAELAMQAQKRAGGDGSRCFEAPMLTTSIAKRDLRQQLDGALSRDELVLFYQPIFELKSGALVGWEALLRWSHPERGLLAPQSFLPSAERHGAIHAIGRWVLRSACRQLAAWRADGQGELTMSVNVAACQLWDPSFADTVAAVLEETGIPPASLELELTENVTHEDLDGIQRVLTAIAALGVRIAVDDFGACHASPSHLKALAVHTLKVDRLFTRNLGDDPQSLAFVSAMMQLARTLSLDVVFEGVEDEAQLASLRALWSTSEHDPAQRARAQGFLMGRPMPAQRATRWSRKRASRGGELSSHDAAGVSPQHTPRADVLSIGTAAG